VRWCVVSLIVVVIILVKRYVMLGIVGYVLDNYPDFVFVERKSLFDLVGRKLKNPVWIPVIKCWNVVCIVAWINVIWAHVLNVSS